MLQHDDCRPHRSGRGSIGLLVAVGRGGEGHQDRRRTTHGQFAEAAGPGAADHQIRVLQQACHCVAEGQIHVGRVLELARVAIVAATEMHHPAAGRQQAG